jgi:hypothetical protein
MTVARAVWLMGNIYGDKDLSGWLTRFGHLYF